MAIVTIKNFPELDAWRKLAKQQTKCPPILLDFSGATERNKLDIRMLRNKDRPVNLYVKTGFSPSSSEPFSFAKDNMLRDDQMG